MMCVLINPGGQIQSEGQFSHPLIVFYCSEMFITYIVLSGEDIVAWIANRFKIDASGKSSTLFFVYKNNNISLSRSLYYRSALRNIF